MSLYDAIGTAELYRGIDCLTDDIQRVDDTEKKQTNERVPKNSYIVV
ncbi:MAG: hypothetical protein ABH883_04125 [Candidatus Omnitrophota bacterium]